MRISDYPMNFSLSNSVFIVHTIFKGMELTYKDALSHLTDENLPHNKFSEGNTTGDAYLQLNCR
jgi:hypothetical protein